jgi:hypothetical protein
MTLPLSESYREIPLTQGQVAIVDAADYEWLNQWKWCAAWMPSTKSFYVVRRPRKAECRTESGLWMHREILSLTRENKSLVDHVNGNSLDNRRCNLRTATHSQNTMNARAKRGSSTGLKGVSWNKNRKRFEARIRVNGKLLFLGKFVDKHEAHSAYCKAATEHFGEFARHG